MIHALILHRKSDGKRVLVGIQSLHVGEDVHPDDHADWPWVETFDEIANALNAQHVIDEEEVKRRRESNADPVVDAEYEDPTQCPLCHERDFQHAVDGPVCIHACAHVMQTFSPPTPSGRTQILCVRVKGHGGDHYDGFPF